ncbi:MAG: hypothetical protein Roseis2KO_31180 [Roseivirga sp.]
MKNLFKTAVVFLLIVLGASACTQKSEYDKLVEKELATNVRQDSLFLGIRFDMDRKEFYAHCWELNKQGVFTQGVGNMSIQYNLDDELKFVGSMQFYPTFTDSAIYEMPVDFQYTEWALWNDKMSNDVLLQDVRALFEKWYGGEFIEVESNDGTMSILVKVDGNRRVRIFKRNVSTVRAVITDLTVLNELKKNS